MNMPDLLNQAIEAARHGQAREAEAMLLEIVEADETNELAWLWLAEVVAEPEERRTCLENVLALNPANAAARHDLQRLNAAYPPDAVLPASPIKPASKALRPSQRPGLPKWLVNVPLPTDPAIFREAHTPAGSERLARWLNTPLSTNKGSMPQSPDEEVMPVSSQDELPLPGWLDIDTPPGLHEQSHAPADVPVPDWLSLDPPATPADPEPPRERTDDSLPDWLSLDPPATPAEPETPREPSDVPVPDWLSLDPPTTPVEPEPPRERTEDSLPDWLSLDPPATPAEPETPREPSDVPVPDWLSLDPPTTPAEPETPRERTEDSLPDWLNLGPPATPVEPETPREPSDVPVPDWLSLDPPTTPAEPETPREPSDVPVPDWLSLDPPTTPVEPEPPRERTEDSLPDWLSLDPPATPAEPETPREPSDVPVPDWLSLDPPATPVEPEPPRAPANVPPPDWLNLDPPATPVEPETPRAPADVPVPDWLNLDPPATPTAPEAPRERTEDSLLDWLSLEAQPIRDEPRASEIANQAEPIRDEAPSNTSDWLSLDAMTAQGSSASEWLSLPPSSSDQAADSAQATPEDSAWPSIDERIARVQQLRAAAPSPETLSDADAPVPEATTPEPVAKASPKKRAFGVPLAPKLIDDPCPFCGTQTYISDRTCRQCQKDLVLRKSPRTKRSLALNILLGLYGINGLFALGISLFGGLALLGIPGNGGEASAAMLSPASLVGLILVTGMSLVIMAGLWQRRPWAYIAHGIGLLFSIITVMVAIFAPTLTGIAILVPLLGMIITTLAGGIGALVLLVLSVMLSVLSMDDFFARMVRITSTGLTMPGEGYQRGLEYRKRGMWHLAAQTWEEAIVEEPRDVTIRRALGFVYAKMQRYDDARECLRVALAIEPDNARLREDLAVIERLRVLEQQR
ncbi:tetratricopeptide repeat protein [Candidatus Chloroploca asiatica]|uniref:Uncharacterized protein n=1 Tax=Candidatus Chloroploca asiatica TaxID=1506545 RepID=A0A2H3KYI0_9CHLR|nr:tetratricopeptide repeat protein [Candidatus Chloroploca asiatica]PDV99044.1 hypothetical protein A9Q02_13870 [Candidatus Chloroploca asiatica]